MNLYHILCSTMYPKHLPFNHTVTPQLQAPQFKHWNSVTFILFLEQGEPAFARLSLLHRVLLRTVTPNFIIEHVSTKRTFWNVTRSFLIQTWAYSTFSPHERSGTLLAYSCSRTSFLGKLILILHSIIYSHLSNHELIVHHIIVFSDSPYLECVGELGTVPVLE